MTSEFQWSKKFRKNSKNGGESARYDTQHSIQYSVKSNLTLRLLMSYIYIYIYIYIYGAPILDVSRSHTTTQHSR